MKDSLSILPISAVLATLLPMLLFLQTTSSVSPAFEGSTTHSVAKSHNLPMPKFETAEWMMMRVINTAYEIRGVDVRLYLPNEILEEDVAFLYDEFDAAITDPNDPVVKWVVYVSSPANTPKTPRRPSVGDSVGYWYASGCWGHWLECVYKATVSECHHCCEAAPDDSSELLCHIQCDNRGYYEGLMYQEFCGDAPPPPPTPEESEAVTRWILTTLENNRRR